MENVSVVLVEPQSAGNIGSVARAMKNTGLGDLVLVNPPEYDNDEGLSMACNATDVLLGARVFGTLAEAVRETPVVVGATRRRGKLRHPVLAMDEAMVEIRRHASMNRVSLLFGREDKGFDNTEISFCDILFEIPTHPAYPSLNLSHAVFIVCWHLFAPHPDTSAIPLGVEAAPRVERDEMFVHMEAALRTLGYGEQEHLLKNILRSMGRLFGRTALMQKEINMLRGIFTQIQERVG